MKNAMEADADWEDDFLLELVDHGLGWEAAEACVDEALAHCAEAGERPDDAFGDAKKYAERIARGRIPASQRARTDYDGKTTMDDYWGAPLLLPGYCLLLGGIVMWIESGLWLDVSIAGLVFTVLFGTLFAVIGAANALRSAGRLRAAVVAWCVALSMTVPAALAAFELPHATLARIPTPSLFPAGALLIWLGTLMQRPGAVGRKASTFLLRRARMLRPAATAEVRNERWLHRLEGLLRGRHEVRRADARRFVDEARAHLEASGAPPEEEFGDVEQYALSLAEGGVRRSSRTALDEHRRLAFFCLCVLQLVTADWPDLHWGEWCFLGLALVSGVSAARQYLAKWRTHRARTRAEGPGEDGATS